MLFALNTILVMVLIVIPLLVLGGYLFVLIIRALRKYINSHGETKALREETAAIKQSLGDAIREQRIRCNMTQEFVAESLGVSRQAVSKWENGTSDPSTSNLLALAKLFGISAEELLRSVE